MAMSKTDVNQIINQALVKLPGATLAAIKAELFDVLDEFFDISSSWVEKVPLDAVAYQKKYSIVVTEGKIIRLGGVFGNSNFSTNAAYDAATAQSQQSSDWIPQGAVMPEIGEIILATPPNNPMAMHVFMIKNVTLPAGRDMIPIGPDWVVPMYHRYLLDGILGKMMGTQNKSYTNDALSVYHLHRFQEGIARARTAALTKNTYGATAWSFPNAFRTRSQRGYLSVGNSRGF